MSTRLVQLHQSLNAGATPEQIATSVNTMLDDLLPFETGVPTPPTVTAAPASDPAAADPPTTASDPAMT